MGIKKGNPCILTTGDIMKYTDRCKQLNEKLRLQENFDIVAKTLQVQDVHMTLYFVDEMCIRDRSMPVSKKNWKQPLRR